MKIHLVSPTHYNADGTLHKTTRYWTSGMTLPYLKRLTPPEHTVTMVDELFYDLEVRPRVLQGKHVPGIGLNHVYEQNTVPQLREVTAAIRELLDEPA